MACLDNWEKIADNDPTWSINLKNAEKTVRAIPIVHVGKNIEIFHTPMELIAKDNGEKRTLEGEKGFGIPRSIYFYAGRCFETTGGFAFAFSQKTEKQNAGSATPFDSGGLFHKKIKGNIKNRISFFKASQFPLSEWRSKFAVFLNMYFFSPNDYLIKSNRPLREDPEKIFTDSENSWQAWSFEIRLENNVRILDLDFCTFSEDKYNDYVDIYLNANHIPPEFDDKVIPAGGLDYLKKIEIEIINRIKNETN